VRRPRAGLIDVDDELVAQRPAQDFIGGGADRVCNLWFETTEFGIRFRCGLFHEDRGDDQVGRRPQTANRKVLDRARGLHAVVRIGGNRKVAERVPFYPKTISHQSLAISH